jgi:hypothetical protein
MTSIDILIRNIYVHMNIYLTELYHKQEGHQLHHDNKNELLNENFLVQPNFIILKFYFKKKLMKQTVSQICNFIWLPSIVIIRAPNSTPKNISIKFSFISFQILPIVKSCTGWNLLSVNWSNKQDFPTPSIKNIYN